MLFKEQTMEVTAEGRAEPNIGWTEALENGGANPPTPAVGDTITLYHDCPECCGLGVVDGVTCEVCNGLGKSGEVKETWQVSTLEARIKAQFEQSVRARGKQAIWAEDNPEHQAVLASAYTSDFAAGHYNWDGRHCRKAMGDLPGIRYLLFLLLKRCQPQITESIAERIFAESPQATALAIKWARGNSESPRQRPAPVRTTHRGATSGQPVHTMHPDTQSITPEELRRAQLTTESKLAGQPVRPMTLADIR